MLKLIALILSLFTTLNTWFPNLLGQSNLPSLADTANYLNAPVAMIGTIDASDPGQREFLLDILDKQIEKKTEEFSKDNPNERMEDEPADMRTFYSRLAGLILPIRFLAFSPDYPNVISGKMDSNPVLVT